MDNKEGDTGFSDSNENGQRFITRTVNFIGLSRFLQTVPSYQENTGNVEIGNCPLRSTRNQ